MAKVEKTESQFVKALNYEIPKEKIETISSSGRALSYVSWAYAWGMFKQIYQDATYEIIKNDSGLPYFVDPDAGIMVYTRITANNETHEMFLFVMNNKNKAMRLVPYEYQAWNSYTKKWETQGVEAATMFDINKTLMRCLVKNMAIFGFGLNIYNGDDLPEFDLEGNNKKDNAPAVEQSKAQEEKPKHVPRKSAPTMTLEIMQNDPLEEVKKILNGLTTIEQMMEVYKAHQQQVESNPDIKTLFGLRKKQISAAKTNEIA